VEGLMKMGKLYLKCFFLLFLRGNVLYGQIQFFPEPVKILPPALDHPELKRKQEQKKEQKQKIQEVQKNTSEVSESHKISHKLKKEFEKNKPSRYLLQFHYTIPKIKITESESQRYGYITGLSSHIHGLYRLTGEDHYGIYKMNFWTGFRLASFTGAGKYQDIPARFGLNYFGPIVGMGKFFEEKDLDRTLAEPLEYSIRKIQYPVRHGFLWLGGISLLSSSVSKDPSNKNLGGDFKTGKPKRDGVSLWSEIQWITMLYKSMTLHYLFGVHKGEGKVITWIGISVGGIY
jgi:hypothetical protein